MVGLVSWGCGFPVSAKELEKLKKVINEKENVIIIEEVIEEIAIL